MPKRSRKQEDTGAAAEERHTKVRVTDSVTKPKEQQKPVGKKISRVSKAQEGVTRTPKNVAQVHSQQNSKTSKPQQNDPSNKNGIAPAREAQNGGKVSDEMAGSLTEAAGGQMLDLDPIFSKDEEHIFVAYRNHVGIYSTRTSLLVRTLQSGLRGQITGFALASENPGSLYIVRKSGMMEKWDWRNGTMSSHKKTSAEISFVTTSKDSAENGLLYTIDSDSDHPWKLTARRFVRGQKGVENVKMVCDQRAGFSGIQVFGGGSVIVASAGAELMIGFSSNPAPADLSGLKYSWRIIKCPDWIASFDVAYKASKNNVGYPSVSVAVGGLLGAIYVYDELYARLMQVERGGQEVSCRQLNWHRNAVLSLKWSLDGTYIISGGQETSLIIWQLETGQKQVLPHLGAPIGSVVESPSGTSYAIRLSDNSAMILGAADLQPTFRIADVYLPPYTNARRFPFVPTVNMPTKPTGTPDISYPVCVSSHTRDQLLLAMPPAKTSSSHQEALNASSLQTCDPTDGRQIERQALTRTKITDLNAGPESNIIEDPNITLMQTSHDSRWLATVDEWMPPVRDVEDKAYDPKTLSEQQDAKREIYLKFWSWNDKDEIWKLISRIDLPHSFNVDNCRPSRVLALAAHPSQSIFSTVGEDGVVRFWRPSHRMRNGVQVADKDGVAQINWKCRYSTALGSPSERWTVAKSAYSSDGSVLAVAAQSGLPSPIYFIDVATGGLQDTQTNLASGTFEDIGLVGRVLIVLSERVVIKDLINDNVIFDHPLDETISSNTITVKPSIAISHQQNAFAITFPHLSQKGNTRTQVFIWDAISLDVVAKVSDYRVIKQILPARARRGWYLITGFGEILTLTPPIALSNGEQAHTTQVSETTTTLKNLPNPAAALTNFLTAPISGPLIKAPTATTNSSSDDMLPDHLSTDSAKRNITRDQLAEIFESAAGNTGDAGSGGWAMPSVSTLFHRVAALYTGRRTEG